MSSMMVLLYSRTFSGRPRLLRAGHAGAFSLPAPFAPSGRSGPDGPWLHGGRVASDQEAWSRSGAGGARGRPRQSSGKSHLSREELELPGLLLRRDASLSCVGELSSCGYIRLTTVQLPWLKPATKHYPFCVTRCKTIMAVAKTLNKLLLSQRCLKINASSLGNGHEIVNKILSYK